MSRTSSGVNRPAPPPPDARQRLRKRLAHLAPYRRAIEAATDPGAYAAAVAAFPLLIEFPDFDTFQRCKVARAEIRADSEWRQINASLDAEVKRRASEVVDFALFDAADEKLRPIERRIYRRHRVEHAMTSSSDRARRAAPCPLAGPPRAVARESHRDRAGHRRTRSTRAGPDENGEPEPPSHGRRCKACGADISHRRADAKTCGQNCRKDKSRGKVAPTPPAIKIDRPLEDEIHARAHERHLAWAAARPDLALIGEIETELAELYAELRRARARQPLPAFAGSIASYDFDVRAAQLWRRPRRRGQNAVTTTQLEAVAA